MFKILSNENKKRITQLYTEMMGSAIPERYSIDNSKLKNFRKSAGLSLLDMADILGMDCKSKKATYFNLESDGKTISGAMYENLKKFGELLEKN